MNDPVSEEATALQRAMEGPASRSAVVTAVRVGAVLPVVAGLAPVIFIYVAYLIFASIAPPFSTILLVLVLIALIVLVWWGAGSVLRDADVPLPRVVASVALLACGNVVLLLWTEADAYRSAYVLPATAIAAVSGAAACGLAAFLIRRTALWVSLLAAVCPLAITASLIVFA